MENKETIKHVWSVLCSNSVVDKDTNNISLNNTIEKLTITVPKGVLEKAKEAKEDGFTFEFPHQIVTMFSRADSSIENAIDLKLEFVNPEGLITSKSERKIGIQKGIKNVRIRDLAEALPLSTSGDYCIRVYYKVVSEPDFNLATELPLEIVIETQE